MTPPLVMVALMAVLMACGIYLMLERSLTRVLLGFLLMGNAVNLLIMLTAGEPGRPPLTDGENLTTEGMSDPLPQALILTAIVITLGMTAFLLAMIYRSWRLARADVVTDDEEDIRIAAAAAGESDDTEAGTSEDYDDTEFGDEAEMPIKGALDLDEDGSPRDRLPGDPNRAPGSDPGVSTVSRGEAEPMIEAAVGPTPEEAAVEDPDAEDPPPDPARRPPEQSQLDREESDHRRGEDA